MTSDLGNTVAGTQPTGDSTHLSEWRENKLQLSQRLQREDMYSHAMQFKEDRRKELRSQGKSKAEANRIAWIEMAEQFSPLYLDIVACRSVLPQLPIEDGPTQAEWLAIHWRLLTWLAWRSFVVEFRPGDILAEKSFVSILHDDTEKPEPASEMTTMAIRYPSAFSALARDACNRRLSKLEIVDDDTEFFHNELQMCLKIIPEVTEFIGTLPSRIAKLEKVA